MIPSSRQWQSASRCQS